MPKGLLEQLAECAVPPAPAELDRRVHERLNRALLAAHLLDLVVGAVPYATGHFLRAVGDLLKVTLTGRLESDRRDGSREAP